MSRLAEKVLRGLSDVGYHGSLLNNKEKFDVALELGQKSVEFTKIVNYLTNEIRSLAGIDEEVNAIDSPEDSVSFVMEVTSFLKELNCPYSSLTQGLVSERLQNVSDRLLLLDYLITELMAVRILQEKKPEKKIELKLQETPEGADMRQILQTLRFPKPPPNITIKQLFDKLDTTVPLVLNKAGADLIGSGLFNGHLSDKQWEILNGVQSDLHKEYKIRREMLLTRLDVTIQSFQWSERTKGKEDKFEKAYFDKRTSLKVEPDVSISDLIAARTDLAIIEKTSNSHVRKNTQSLFQKVVIGQVPDRGGRSWEQPPPPPEMPSWQQNRTAGPPARGGGGQGNRGGGQSNRGGGQSNRGGYQGGGGGGSGYNSRDNSGDRGSYQSNYQNQGGGYKSAYGAGSNQSFGRGGGGYGGNYGNYNRGDDSYGRNSRRDSGGGSSYGGNQDYGQNKRPKTYDSYQPNKNTYADQYVQERDHNQQYHRGRGGRGRSNYHRGGGGNYH